MKVAAEMRLPGAMQEGQEATTHAHLVHTALYCSSGALWNLSRHPGNHQQLYQLELRLKTRSAAVDVLQSAAASGGLAPSASNGR
jgi:hypothetical protein